MTTPTQTCTERNQQGELCGGTIRPSYIEPVTSVLGEPRKPQGEIVHPAACRQCGKSYADILAVPMTADDLNIVGDRLSESTRQALQGAATELTPGLYEVAMTEQGARDLAAKAANLGLVVIGQKIRQELNGLSIQRRKG